MYFIPVQSLDLILTLTGGFAAALFFRVCERNGSPAVPAVYRAGRRYAMRHVQTGSEYSYHYHETWAPVS